MKITITIEQMISWVQRASTGLSEHVVQDAILDFLRQQQPSSALAHKQSIMEEEAVVEKFETPPQKTFAGCTCGLIGANVTKCARPDCAWKLNRLLSPDSVKSHSLVTNSRTK